MATGLFQEISDYIHLSKDSLDLLRAALSVLPSGQKRDEAEHKLRTAEEALKRSDAALALKLGYQLCQCTFPPQIMLWEESTKTKKCQRCGHTNNFNRPLNDEEDSWITVRS